MTKKTHTPPALPRILSVRGRKVVLDSDLAALYGVPTFRLNEAVKRNKARFPDDFRFQLTAEEVANLKSQIAISSSNPDGILRSQFAILESDGRGKHRKFLPWLFNEVVDRLQPLLDAPAVADDTKPKIGFHRGNR